MNTRSRNARTDYSARLYSSLNTAQIVECHQPTWSCSDDLGKSMKCMINKRSLSVVLIICLAPFKYTWGTPSYNRKLSPNFSIYGTLHCTFRAHLCFLYYFAFYFVTGKNTSRLTITWVGAFWPPSSLLGKPFKVFQDLIQLVYYYTHPPEPMGNLL